MKGAMIATAAAVSSAIWQWCTHIMAQWIPMGLEESMMVWFGSVDVGSAGVIDLLGRSSYLVQCYQQLTSQSTKFVWSIINRDYTGVRRRVNLCQSGLYV